MKKNILFTVFISLACFSMEKKFDDLVVNTYRPLSVKIADLSNFRPGSIEYRLLNRSIRKDFKSVSSRDYKLYKKLYSAQKVLVVQKVLDLLQEPSSSSEDEVFFEISPH